MNTLHDITCLRVLLCVLGLQKAVDSVVGILHPPTAYAVLRVLGFEDIASHDSLYHLLPQLWGCASLAWAYFLLRGARDPRRNGIILEGSVLGFAAVGLVAVLTPMPWVRVIGILLIVEAALLLIGRWRMAQLTTVS